MAKTKVLHLTYDMHIGGTEMVIKNIIEGSDNDLFEMSIFCIEEPLGPWGIELQQKGGEIHCHARKPGFDTSLIKAIRNYLKLNKIDVIHCHQYTPWVYGALAAFGLKAKVVFTEHGRFYPDSGSWKRRLVNPWLCRITNVMTSISGATKEALVEFENIPSQKIEIIYNGIAPLEINNNEVSALRQALGIPSGATILGTVARLDPIKNHTMMLRAFVQVLKEHPESKLLIVGDGEERQNIENLICRLNLESKVILTGYKADPKNYMALMDIFLLPSLSEGASMTLLEAMSLSKPCVVTDAGGNKELIGNDVNGCVTPNNSAVEYAKALTSLMGDPVRIEKYAENSLKRYKELFHYQRMTACYRELYDQLGSHSRGNYSC